MNVHRANAVLERDGTLILKDLPFQAGDTVEVIVREKRASPDKTGSAPLFGTVLHYDDPTESVAVQDWNAMK